MALGRSLPEGRSIHGSDMSILMHCGHIMARMGIRALLFRRFWVLGIGGSVWIGRDFKICESRNSHRHITAFATLPEEVFTSCFIRHTPLGIHILDVGCDEIR